jgi:hypothetical protein
MKTMVVCQEVTLSKAVVKATQTSLLAMRLFLITTHNSLRLTFLVQHLKQHQNMS